MGRFEQQSIKPPPGQIKHDSHTVGTLDQSSYDTHGTATTTDDEMYFGDGNHPTNYNISVDDKTGIELGLKVHERQGDDILPVSVNPDGSANYEVPAGLQDGSTNRAAWNFDFSVNTGLDGSTKTLADYEFRIIIADDDGHSQSFDLQHLGPGNTPWVNVNTGSGATLGNFGDEDGSNPQLSQNSVNLGFGFLQAAFGPDTLAAGENHDIALQAFNHGGIVAQVQDHILLV